MYPLQLQNVLLHTMHMDFHVLLSVLCSPSINTDIISSTPVLSHQQLHHFITTCTISSIHVSSQKHLQHLITACNISLTPEALINTCTIPSTPDCTISSTPAPHLQLLRPPSSSSSKACLYTSFDNHSFLYLLLTSCCSHQTVFR